LHVYLYPPCEKQEQIAEPSVAIVANSRDVGFSDDGDLASVTILQHGSRSRPDKFALPETWRIRTPPGNGSVNQAYNGHSSPQFPI